MQTVMMVYNLKKSVAVEDYKKYSIQVDQPLVNSLPSVKEFNVYFVIGPEKVWDIFETIVIDNWDKFVEETQTDEMIEADNEWRQWIDEDSLKIVFGEKILK
jgi:hypothetical protein